MTTNSLANKLRNVDEISLLEVLRITSDDIVDRFSDYIEARADYLEDEFLDEDNEDDVTEWFDPSKNYLE